MVVVVVIAIVGDGRDVVAIGIESGVIGSIYNYDELDAISMCIYFRFLAVCITLIAKKVCTLLHLAGYFFKFCFLEESLLNKLYRIIKQSIIRESR